MNTLRLYTKRLVLCTADDNKIKAADLLAIHERNHNFWQPWGPALPADFLTLQVQSDRLQTDLESLYKGTGLRFFIMTADNDETDTRPTILGDINFSNIVRGIFQSCHLGCKIDENMQGRGYMVEALQAAIEYMFEVKQLHRIEANIMPRNKASVRVAEKLGFTCEGLSRKYLKINNQWEDHLRYVVWNDAV